MIAFLTGSIAGRGEGFALLDVAGVGYRLAMSASSLASLPRDGEEVTVLTHLHVRDDEISLFGFQSADEKDLFELLIGVGGVGPKLALAILSAFSPDAFAEAVAREDAGLISSVPGVGKKTAQRVIIELKDKLGVGDSGETVSVGVAVDALSAAREALQGMGFTSAEVAAAVKGYEGNGRAEDVVRYALRRLGGGA